MCWNLVEEQWVLESNKPEMESRIHHCQPYLNMVPRITELQSPHLQNRHWYYVHFRGKQRLHERKNHIHPLSLSVNISYSESPSLAPQSG